MTCEGQLLKLLVYFNTYSFLQFIFYTFCFVRLRMPVILNENIQQYSPVYFKLKVNVWFIFNSYDPHIFIENFNKFE